jgi:hypothetical protein
VRLERRRQGLGRRAQLVGKPGKLTRLALDRGAHRHETRDVILVRHVIGVHLRERGIQTGVEIDQTRHHQLVLVVQMQRERDREVAMDLACDLARFAITDVGAKETTLETVFINLTGRDLRE